MVQSYVMRHYNSLVLFLAVTWRKFRTFNYFHFLFFSMGDLLLFTCQFFPSSIHFIRDICKPMSCGHCYLEMTQHVFKSILTIFPLDLAMYVGDYKLVSFSDCKFLNSKMMTYFSWVSEQLVHTRHLIFSDQQVYLSSVRLDNWAQNFVCKLQLKVNKSGLSTENKHKV